MSLTNTNNLGFDYESPAYRFGPLETQANNCLCIPIVYGQVRAAGNQIWQSTGTDIFTALVCFADGPITGFSDIRINNVPIADPSLAGCSYTAYLGNGTQQIDSRVPGNTQTDKANLVGGLKYSAYLALTVKSGTKVADNYFNVSSVIQGKPVNIYSTISTCTPEYSNNPIWCILDFLTCYNGCGISISNIDVQSFINAAAYCDVKINPVNATGQVSVISGSATVTGTGTKFTTDTKVGDQVTINGVNNNVTAVNSDTSLTVNSSFSSSASGQTMSVADTRYTLNLILDTRKTRQNWLNEMLVCCRAYLKYNGNQISVSIEQNESSVQSFTQDEIIADSEVFWTTPKEQRCDIFKVRYMDPVNEYARSYAVAEANTFLNDPPIIQEIVALGVTNFKQASRLAWFYLNQANNCSQFIAFNTTQTALNITPGDIIQITSTFLGYVNKNMTVVSMNETQAGQIQLICREYNGATNSTLTTNLTPADSNLVYTSVVANDASNNITIQYTNPYQPNQSLSVSVSGTNINVNLATDSNSHITSTASQIMSAVQGNQQASALVSVALASSDGNGVVSAIAQTNLTGGSSGLYADLLGTDAPVFNTVSIADVLGTPADVQNFSAAQNINTIVLSWQPNSENQINYEIREGYSWTQSTLVATNLTGSSYTQLNIGLGTFQYWIKAINKYGNYSTDAMLATVVVSNIPSVNNIASQNILSGNPSGILNNSYLDSSRLILNPNNVTWQNGGTWNNPGISNNYYDQNNNWGAACVNSGSYTTGVYDMETILTSIVSLNYNLSSTDASNYITIKWQYSQDNVNWSGWQPFVQGSYIFRYYQFIITLYSPNMSYAAATNFVVNMTVPDRDLYFHDQVITNASTGVTVIFNPSFIINPTVVANISNGVSGYCVVTKTTSQATVMAYNNSGTAINANVDIRVKGY